MIETDESLEGVYTSNLINKCEMNKIDKNRLLLNINKGLFFIICPVMVNLWIKNMKKPIIN